MRAIDGFAKFFGYRPDRPEKDSDIVETKTLEDAAQTNFEIRQKLQNQAQIPIAESNLESVSGVGDMNCDTKQETVTSESDKEKGVLGNSLADSIRDYGKYYKDGISDQEDKDQDNDTQRFNLGLLVEATIRHLQNEEIKRRPISSDETNESVNEEDPDVALYNLEKIAWHLTDWGQVTFKYDGRLSWGEHVGFVERKKYPIFSFCENIARCFFAAEFGIFENDDVAFNTIWKNKNKGYTPLILKIYNDLRVVSGKNEIRLSS